MLRFVNVWFNNCGDPFGQDYWASLPPMQMEKAIIRYFAQLLKLDSNSCWGYVSGSSSESLLYGLSQAKE
jgi:glutamate/tyrosine decarboxylase-like PLP-dependent enzyme